METSNLTLCPVKLYGDIPTFNAKTIDERADLFESFIQKIDLNKTVLVIFQNWRGLEINELRNEQRGFYIGHDDFDASCFFDEINENVSNENLDLAVFAFESYQDAFKYCLDLKESF